MEPVEITSEWISQFKTYKEWYKGLKRRSRTGKVSATMKSNYDSTMKQYVTFVNSKIGFEKIQSPDDIIKHAEEIDPEEVLDMINNFERWLSGKEIKDENENICYRPRVLTRNERYAKPNTASQKAQGAVRGFYTHNRIWLPKGRKGNEYVPETRKNDENFAIFKTDDKSKTIVQDYEDLRFFLSNLKFRDQVIAIALLSTSQDIGDLLSLKIKFVTDQQNRKRLYWTESRNKTGVLFRTFFSKEATTWLRQYIEQKRNGAEPDELIFIRTKGKPLLQRHITSTFNDTARKMGLKREGIQHPFRPKRFRSIFDTACFQAKIDDAARHIFMGHTRSISEKYRNMPTPNLELIYSQVEPFITVYSKDRGAELAETRVKSQKALDLAIDIREENKRLKNRLEKVERYITNLQNMYQEKLSPDQEAMIVELATNIEALPREERVQQLKVLLFAWSKVFKA